MSEQSGHELSTQDIAGAGQGAGAQQQQAGGRNEQFQSGGQDSGERQPYAQGSGAGERQQYAQADQQSQPGGRDAGERQQYGQSAQPHGGAPGGGQQGQAMGAGVGGSDGLVQDSQGFRQRWTEIQAAFVDEPRRAVEQADGLVAEVIQHLARTFAEERSSLEGQWAGGNSVSTEDLRVSLQRYRQFFQTLLRD